jgi:D,D-heptose 1,7-bisphosphate phosphatase
VPTATLTHCIILADAAAPAPPGSGLALATPLALESVGDRPFLAWLIRELMRFGVTDYHLTSNRFAGELARAIPTIQARLPHPVRISMIAHPSDTAPEDRLRWARDRLPDRFLLCDGGALFDGNLAALLAEAAGDSATAAWAFAIADTDETAAAAVLVVDRLALAGLTRAGGAEGLLAHFARTGLLRRVPGHGSVHRVITFTDLAAARVAIPRTLRRSALFLDRDGVLNLDHGYVGTQARFEFTEGAQAALRHAADAGWHVFVATNQSGVARGFYTECDVQTLMAWVGEQVRRAGGTIDDTRYCPYHPEADIPAYRRSSDWRKPAPGMLMDLLRAWEVDAARSVLVGDQPSDLEAAAAAGIRSHRFLGGDLLAFIRPLLEHPPG